MNKDIFFLCAFLILLLAGCEPDGSSSNSTDNKPVVLPPESEDYKEEYYK